MNDGTTEVSRLSPAGAQRQEVARSQWDDPAMVRTLMDTVAKNATDSEFRMFVELCNATGLNPLLREIWCAVPMKDGKRNPYGQVLIMAGHAGYLRIANEHPQFDGMHTEILREKDGIPIKAVCEIWRKDRSHSTKFEAYFSEYYKPGYNGKPSIWDTYKSAMIAKVAEIMTIKRCFSIHGLVSPEEIGEQNPEPTRAEGIAAAQAVAEVKLAEMRNERAAKALPEPVATVEAEPVSDDDKLAEALQKSVDVNKYKALAAFGDLKKEIIAQTGDDKLYYRALGSQGYEKSNQIPADKLRPVFRAVAKELTDWKGAQPLGGAQ
jgi:phage recombination protein Bet